MLSAGKLLVTGGAILLALVLASSVAFFLFGLLFYEVPSPVMQWPLEESKPVHQTTEMDPGVWTVDVWGGGTGGCRLVVRVAGEPVPREDRVPQGAAPHCRTSVTTRKKAAWTIDAETYGPTDGPTFANIRPDYPFPVSFRWAKIFGGGALGTIVLGAIVMMIGRARAR